MFTPTITHPVYLSSPSSSSTHTHRSLDKSVMKLHRNRPHSDQHLHPGKSEQTHIRFRPFFAQDSEFLVLSRAGGWNRFRS